MLNNTESRMTASRWIRFAMLITLVFGGIFAACGTEETLNQPDAAAPATSNVGASSPAVDTPRNPALTDTGIRIIFPADSFGETGDAAEVQYKACEADAYAHVQYGKVVDVSLSPDSFNASAAEQTYLPSGDAWVTDDPTLVTQPVYRDKAGRLIASWRLCEDVKVDENGFEAAP
jgi:hypothetical protein